MYVLKWVPQEDVQERLYLDSLSKEDKAVIDNLQGQFFLSLSLQLGRYEYYIFVEKQVERTVDVTGRIGILVVDEMTFLLPLPPGSSLLDINRFFAAHYIRNMNLGVDEIAKVLVEQATSKTGLKAERSAQMIIQYLIEGKSLSAIAKLHGLGRDRPRVILGRDIRRFIEGG